MKNIPSQFAFTHIDKILFPAEGITKGEMITYYQQIAQNMLPFMADRPVTMQRFVNGINAESFFQKDGSHFPDWIKKKLVKKQDGRKTKYIICNTTETLTYLANQNCITIHLWLSTIYAMRKPDRLIFDLDPSIEDFTLVIKTALKIKELLATLGLQSFAMTTGSRGIHVVIPIKPIHSYDLVRKFAVEIAKLLIINDPENLTLALTKQKRGNKLFIDTLRNQFGATAVAPYSLRAINSAPVATPVTWNELQDLPSAQFYTISTIFDKLKKIPDPWPHFFELQQELTVPSNLLNQINVLKRI